MLSTEMNGAVKRPRAVIVEDNLVIALDLADMLSLDLGFDVLVGSADAIRALAEIAEFQPDLVISDLSVLERRGLTPIDLCSTGHRLIIFTGNARAARRYAKSSIEVIEKPCPIFRVAELVAAARISS